jgi:hypothetical protein
MTMKYRVVINYVNGILSQYTMKLTLRQVYYRLVAGYSYPNTKSAYNQLSKQLVKARKRGDIDETRIEDRSREFLGEDYGWDSPEDFVTYQFKTFLDSPNYYARKMWTSQPEYVIIWVEKDALSRVISTVADKFNVVTCPSRGYASYTYIKEAIARLPEDKHITILHFADHDPSGIDMTRDLEERFHNYSDLDIEVERIALTHNQVQYYELPPNPTKRADPRAKSYIAEYGNECRELDAIEPVELQRMVSEAIESHIDPDIWKQNWEQMQQEREELRTLFSSIKNLLMEHGYYVPPDFQP